MCQSEEQGSVEGSDGVSADTGQAAGVSHSTQATPVPPLVMYLDTLVEQLRSHIPAALQEFDAVGVHQARVSTRRLSAALGLLAPLVSKGDLRALGKLLKKLRRRLGPHRDLDVLIEHLRELGEQSPELLPATDHLGRALAAKREELRVEALEEGGVNRALGRLAVYLDAREALVAHGLADEYRPLIAGGVHAGFDEFSVLSDLLSHQLAEREGLSGIDPHELRIAGKHLRYSLELAAADGAPLPSDVFKDFKKMQDALGLWHDHVVLAETAILHLSETALLHRDADLAGTVLSLARDTAGRAGKHLRDFADLWTARGAGLTETIRAEFPLSRSVGGQ